MKHQKKVAYSVLTTAALFTSILLPSQAQADAPSKESTTPVSSIMSYEKGKETLKVEKVANFSSGAEFAEGGTEIVTYDPATKRLFSVNGAESAVDIIDLSSLKQGQSETKKLPLMKRVQLEDLSGDLSNVSGITSVSLHPNGDYAAVAVPAEPAQDAGYVVFMDIDGNYISHVSVGALPDMVTFTPDGKKLLVANEGEPSEDYETNPEGSVSIIDVTGNIDELTEESVKEVTFKDAPIDEDIRKMNQDNTYEEDLEPEYIVVEEDGKTAYVVLQESNAVATLDIEAGSFTEVKSLGYKDHSLKENGFDASNEDGEINIEPHPVLGMYQPDGIALFEKDGKSYLLTPNEGDAQDYDGYSEETRVGDIADQYDLKSENFEGYTQKELDRLVENGLFEEDQLGRLKTTISAPKNEDGKYEAVYGYGARSFTIRDTASMDVVYDSADEFEQVAAKALPDFFNTDDEENAFDNRSDDKGPEPEAVVTGSVGDKDYAFVGLERQSGIMVYDITNPEEASFVKYFTSRDFSKDMPAGDVAPEGLQFLEADHSPTGEPLLIAGHEISGTIAAYSLTDLNDGENKNDDRSNEDVHEVENGDTLSEIALSYGMHWHELQEINQLDNPHLIYPDQKIVLEEDKDKSSK
ncbi:LysM domain-containing protein [Halobacillus alkaliphilus]|uniref:LysM domain-containing protein n=1 Tax=Halobacillus alkaliphilus TaxID=396056 RepID=A0A1I2JT31_9BACI|nr:choice-of-anchor I family protein [Halobacillus alkaliphilus]SFF57734.1 LysM domain-containing protein [Halobacillus alkaliphilus]